MDNQKNLNVSLDNLLEQGMQSYLFALLTVQQFRVEVQKRTLNALTGKIKELGDAMGRDIDESWLKPYINPDGLSDPGYDGSRAEVSLKLFVAPVDCYFGMRFELDGEGKTESYVTVNMWPWTKEQMHFLLQKTKEVTDDFNNNMGNEIEIREILNPAEHEFFEKKLIALIDKWIAVWKKVGGIDTMNNGFPSEFATAYPLKASPEAAPGHP
ncbi:MAG: hypothetical protein NT178_18060 [Proteobacteria bacterium]|nr:hypothetical protein [Pseudomonadota bacterium]